MGLIRVESKHVVFKNYHTRQFESQNGRCMSTELRDLNMKFNKKSSYLSNIYNIYITHRERNKFCISMEIDNISNYKLPVEAVRVAGTKSEQSNRARDSRRADPPFG